MRSAIDMMQRCVWVPIKFEGKLVEAPFVLFNDWTLEERQWYWEGLKELKTILTAASEREPKGLCYQAGFVGLEFRRAVQQFFNYHLDTDYLTSLAELGVCPDLDESRRAFRQLWIDTQMAMIAVPEFEF